MVTILSHSARRRRKTAARHVEKFRPVWRILTAGGQAHFMNRLRSPYLLIMGNAVAAVRASADKTPGSGQALDRNLPEC